MLSSRRISSLKQPEIVRVLGSKDTTRKFLFRLADGNLIESVLIPASPALYGETSDRRTICVSTQVGCAYGCKFCASGLDGFSRNLDPNEIVDQVLAVETESGEKIDNIVFMGMGEPLANLTNLLRAIRIINAPWGLGIGARHITISTSGLAPQIRKLALEPTQFRLAISLHGATDEVRSQIMPVNRKYNLATLLEACDYYVAQKKRLMFEYILIAGVNDSDEQAHELARHARSSLGKNKSHSLQHGRGPEMVATFSQPAGKLPAHPAQPWRRRHPATGKGPRHRGCLRAVALADEAG